MERTSKAEEAILLASEPRDIRKYLASRAAQANLFDPISQETEAELLATKDRLLDLSLAEYCLHPETAQTLFERNRNDWPIRALVLSNRALAKANIRDFPACLFGSEEALATYLSNITPDERHVLFRNPSLADSFLEAFLSLQKPWEAMDRQQRLFALDDLAKNEKLHRDRTTADFDEGWDWYMAGKPFQAAWSLIENLDPSKEAAKFLGALLRDLPADSFELDGIAKALNNWTAEDLNDAKQDQDNSEDKLSEFQIVRQAGARLLASSHDADIVEFLNAEDIAFRCGGYEAALKLDAEAIEDAVSRDGEIARLHLIRNKNLWQRKKMRDLLFEKVLSGSETENVRWEFRRRDTHYRKEHSSWFEDDPHSEPDQRPITSSSIADIVKGVISDPSFRCLQDRIASLERKQRTNFWMLGLALVVLIVHVWR